MWRIVTKNNYLNITQLVTQYLSHRREPVDFHSRLKAHREREFGWLRGATRGFPCRIDLCQREPRVIEKGATRRSRHDAAGGTRQERGAHLIFQISNLPTQGRLRRVQLLLRSFSEAPCLDNRDVVTQMAKFHKVPPCFRSMRGSLQSLVHVRYGNLQ